jgi:dynactin-2
LEEINTAKAENDGGIADLTLENMTVQLGLMHKQLLELRLEDVLGEEVIHTMTDPQAAARKKLLSQLEQLKTVGVGGKKKVDTNSPSYSLYIKQSTSALEEGAMLSSLSSRLAVLEASVGFSADQMSILTMETGKKSISQAVQVLSAKTTLMDPNKLDHIEGQNKY